jgi:hypothetical protein
MYKGTPNQLQSILFRYVTVPAANMHGNHKPTCNADASRPLTRFRNLRSIFRHSSAILVKTRAAAIDNEQRQTSHSSIHGPLDGPSALRAGTLPANEENYEHS